MVFVQRSAGSAAVLLAVSALWSSALAFNVTVNESTKHQTIEGLGAQNVATSWRYKQGPFYINVNLDSVHYFDTVMLDGGHSIMRDDPVTSFQATQGDFSIPADVRAALTSEAKYERIAQQHGQVFHLLWNCFSPPPWMKANNSAAAIGGANDPNNYLMPSHFTDFANHWIRLLQIARDTFGVDVYAISLQNEPLFDEPYVSCNYSHGAGCGWNGICYNAMFKVVAPLIHAAFPNVKFAASEDLNRTTIETSLRADAVSNPLVYAWASHNDYASSFAYWTDRPIWNTEAHAMSFMESAQMIMSNLQAGANAYIELNRVDNCGTSGTPNTDCAKAGTYRAIKMYARYVRPGSQVVQSTGSVSGSYGVMAFYHPTDTCLVIVLVNATASATTAALSVAGSYLPAQFSVFQSTNSVDEAALGIVAINGTVSLPDSSVTTLVAGKYLGSGVVRTVGPARSPAIAGRASTAGPVRIYALDGRLMATMPRTGVAASTPGRLASGVYCAAAGQAGVWKRYCVTQP
jgi:O-glycosyl hydrolase